jgi:aldose 1-epimerase
MAHPPLVLESDELEVVVLPQHGARIHRIRAFGVDLLRSPEDVDAHGTEPFFWGAYVMAPWCNRVWPGPMEVAGRTVDVAPNFPDGSAIHGQVYGRPWRADDGWFAVIGGDDGWPWAYEVRLRPTLEGSTLRLTCQLTNRSDEPMPAGLGLHPWFVRPVHVGVAAETVYASNTDSPAQPQPVHGTVFDLRSSSPPPSGLDATWSSLLRPLVHLRWPDAGIEAALEVRTDAAACVAVATPTDPDATAVEPQTHGPDGLRRVANGEPDALTLLPPDGTQRLELQLRVRRVTD